MLLHSKIKAVFVSHLLARPVLAWLVLLARTETMRTDYSTAMGIKKPCCAHLPESLHMLFAILQHPPRGGGASCVAGHTHTLHLQYPGLSSTSSEYCCEDA